MFFLVLERHSTYFFFFFFNDAAPPKISPLPLHAPLPISSGHLAGSWLPPHQPHLRRAVRKLLGADDLEAMATVEGDIGLFLRLQVGGDTVGVASTEEDRKSTRLNSSHQIISYAVFCLKKK